MATKKTASEKYGYYLGQLETLSGKDYLSLFKSVYERIVNENGDKVKAILNKITESDQERDRLGDLAIKELTPYYNKLISKLELETTDDESKYWIDFAEGAISGRNFLFGNGLADLLFETIRKVLERNPRCGYLEEILLYRVSDRSAYVSNELVKLFFPNYYAYDCHNRKFDSTSDTEPWGDYAQLNFYYTNGNGFGVEEINAFRNSIKKHLLKFLNYIDSIDDFQNEKRKNNGTDIAEIKNLLILKYSPDGIQYTGENKSSLGFRKANRRSQPFATLFLAYNKFTKRKSLGSTKIALSYTEIDDCLSDSKKCNRPLMASSTVNRKRKLDLLLSNIRKKVPFTHDEAYVSGDTESDSPKLNLEVRKNK